jgi:hypothetical protein
MQQKPEQILPEVNALRKVGKIGVDHVRKQAIKDSFREMKILLLCSQYIYSIMV